MHKVWLLTLDHAHGRLLVHALNETHSEKAAMTAFVCLPRSHSGTWTCVEGAWIYCSHSTKSIHREIENSRLFCHISRQELTIVTCLLVVIKLSPPGIRHILDPDEYCWSGGAMRRSDGCGLFGRRAVSVVLAWLNLHRLPFFPPAYGSLARQRWFVMQKHCVCQVNNGGAVLVLFPSLEALSWCFLYSSAVLHVKI